MEGQPGWSAPRGRHIPTGFAAGGPNKPKCSSRERNFRTSWQIVNLWPDPPPPQERGSGRNLRQHRYFPGGAFGVMPGKARSLLPSVGQRCPDPPQWAAEGMPSPRKDLSSPTPCLPVCESCQNACTLEPCTFLVAQLVKNVPAMEETSV